MHTKIKLYGAAVVLSLLLPFWFTFSVYPAFAELVEGLHVFADVAVGDPIRIEGPLEYKHTEVSTSGTTIYVYSIKDQNLGRFNYKSVFNHSNLVGKVVILNGVYEYIDDTTPYYRYKNATVSLSSNQNSQILDGVQNECVIETVDGKFEKHPSTDGSFDYIVYLNQPIHNTNVLNLKNIGTHDSILSKQIRIEAEFCNTGGQFMHSPSSTKNRIIGVMEENPDNNNNTNNNDNGNNDSNSNTNVPDALSNLIPDSNTNNSSDTTNSNQDSDQNNNSNNSSDTVDNNTTDADAETITPGESGQPFSFDPQVIAACICGSLIILALVIGLISFVTRR
jgi:hypothetical protein